jgi:hypothetical protein
MVREMLGSALILADSSFVSALPATLNSLIILVAVYAAGATACSFINEALAGALQLRGSTLYRGLVDLACGARDFVDELYQHPLVYPGNNTESPRYNRSNWVLAWLGAENNWPSYVDARSFSVAFWQTLRNRLATDQSGANAISAAANPQELFDDLKLRINAIDASTSDLGALKQTLGSMLTRANGDYDQLLILTDSWFNKQMDRVGGWYRRTAQWILLVFASVLCFGLNIDTVHIVTFFNGEAALATQLVSDITTATEATPSPSTSASPAVSSSPSPTTSPSQEEGAFEKAKRVDTALTDHDLPLTAFINPGGSRSLQASFGDLITAAAFAMGAPFWFDLLGKLINVRMAGRKPKKSTSDSH